MNKTTLNFVAMFVLKLTQTLEINSLEHKKEAKHPTPAFV